MYKQLRRPYEAVPLWGAGFEAALVEGEDLARPVPLERWDVDSPGAADDVVQTNMLRFGTMCSDIDKFDNGYFRLGRAEAAAMDPQQRALLEQISLAWQVGPPSEALRAYRRYVTALGMAGRAMSGGEKKKRQGDLSMARGGMEEI